MYHFLKTHLFSLICFLVIVIGCTERKISREFSDTMKDGSRVEIKIEYKPKSFMNSKGEKVGSYYFIAKYFFGGGPFDAIFEEAEYEKPRYLRKARIYISFYDPENHLLFKRFTPDGYAINFANHEENTFDGGMEWKGQFDESIITVENFRDIHSITATKK